MRSDKEVKRARSALKLAGVPLTELDEGTGPEVGRVAISTMHFAKGLEFKCVALMSCDDEIIPSQERIESVADDADLEGLRYGAASTLRRLHPGARSSPGDWSRARFRVCGDLLTADESRPPRVPA